MKIVKGSAGYIRMRKKRVILKTILQFGIVIALLILGIVQTGDRLNLLTLVAILGCLPAAKSLVEVIMIFPHHSIDEKMAGEIESKAELLTKAYDMVFTSNDHIMPVDSIVISDNTICGYSSSQKIDIAYTTKHIRQILEQNKYQKITVKIFDNYTAFLTRAEGLNNIAAIEKNDTKKKEDALRHLILNISL